MNNLFTYILALKESISGLTIIEQVSNENNIEEDGVLIEKNEVIVKFDNGVTLRKQIEYDHIGTMSDEVCSEYWIDYDVISQPENVRITPNKKSFTNECQEIFWLKINQVQAST